MFRKELNTCSDYRQPSELYLQDFPYNAWALKAAAGVRKIFQLTQRFCAGVLSGHLWKHNPAVRRVVSLCIK